MNYGVLVLGATISISLFLRICAGSVSNTNIYFPKETRAELYEELKKNPTVYSWVTGNKFYVIEEMIHRIWQINLHGTFDSLSILDQATDFISEIRPWEATKRKIPKDYARVLPQSDEDVCDMDWKSNESESQLWTDDPLDNSVPTSEESEGDTTVEGCSYTEFDKKLYCGDKTISDMPQFPKNVVDLVQFHLVSTNVDDVPKLAFGNMTILNIVLKNNRLKYIHPLTFSRVKNLSTLSIINNELDFISREFFAGLNDTMILRLDDNLISFKKFENCTEKPISEIPAILPSLRMFTLNGNPLEIIPKQMFAGMRSSPLTTLYLPNCRLNYIHPEAFSYLGELENLNLSENPKLKFDEAFLGLRNTKLLILDLSSNNLLDVPKAALRIVAPSLQNLNLENNFFNTITAATFPDMKRLTSLNLKNCRIDTIEQGALDKMSNLENLILSDNRLKIVPPSVSNLRNLKYLKLSNNMASSFSIERGVFANLSKLQSLEMNDLNLGYIQIYAFSGLSSLETLYLDNVKVETVEDYAFAEMRLLKTLTMRGSFSKIRAEFNSLTFFGLDNLKTLYLDRNNISLFDPEKVPSSDIPIYSSGTNELRKGNKTDAMLQRPRDFASPFKYLKNLQYLLLSDNRIEHLYPEVFIGLDSLKNMSLDRNIIQSWQKPLFPNGTSLELLQLTKNNLGPVTEEMLKDFMEINKADLSENSFLCEKGACELKELVDDLNVTLVDWKRSSSYRCVDLSTNSYYNMNELPAEICDRAIINPPPDTGDKEPIAEEVMGSSIIITIGIVCFCGILIMTAIVTGYRKRVHLKYFLFVVKFNVLKISEKAKNAVAEVTCYNYDIFISYHNDDTKFVKEFFLPEVENGPGSSLNQDKYDEKDINPQLKVCFHERDFEVGVPISDNILECVDQSKKVVVLVSKKYLESQWCVFEMKLAYHRLIEARRKSFLIILMEDIPNELKTKVLNYLMKSRTYLEWPGIHSPLQEQKIFWNRLRNSIKSAD